MHDGKGIGLLRIPCFILIILCFSANLSYAAELQIPKTCRDLFDKTNAQKYESFSLDAYTAKQIAVFEENYPDRNISSLKEQVAAYKPDGNLHTDDAPPFLYLIILACQNHENEDVDLQTQIQNALYAVSVLNQQKK